MRRILIVDDEGFILNGLSAMIKEAEFADLEVCKALSAIEALDWMQRAAIDVVLTDICMPGMDGLELQRQIARQWPRCKVLFLTGHDDFSYVKEAIHYRAVDYILKTESDDAVLAAVAKALEELESEGAREAQFEQARHRFQAALPALQNEFLSELLEGELPGGRRLQEQFDDLRLPLSEAMPVLPVLGRVDEWQNYRRTDRSLLLFAVQNVAEEWFADAAIVKSIVYGKTRVAWFIQPLNRQEDGAATRLVRFVQGTVERIQITCKDLLKLKISFAVASACCSWPLIPQRCDALDRALRRSLGAGSELLLTDEALPTYPESGRTEAEIKRCGKAIDELIELLETGQRDGFRRKLGEVATDGALRADPDVRLTAMYRLISTMLTFLAGEGLLQPLLNTADMDSLMKPETHESWELTMQRVERLGDLVLQKNDNQSRQYGKSLVLRLKQHIEANLSEDLSLVKLGQVVSLNPSYLSRLYKQLTGESLSDTIMAARLVSAKRKLRDTDDKVQDIAVQVGFESAAYFNRFFKKASGLTPQEYREQARL